MQGLVDKVSDSFLARALQLALDLNNPQLLYDILTSEISYEEEEELINSRVFEALGSKAKTEYSDEQLSGLGFSTTSRNNVIVKVDNKSFKIVF